MQDAFKSNFYYPDFIMGAEKLYAFLRKWSGPTASVVLVLAAIFTGVQYIIKSEVADIRSDTGTLKGNVGTLQSDLKTDMGKANERIDVLLKDALERAFPRPAITGKADIRGSLKKADGLLRLAKSQNIKLNPSLISSYGTQVASLTSDRSVSDLAWGTLSTVLDYRSFINPSPGGTYTPVSSSNKEVPGVDGSYLQIIMREEDTGMELHYEITVGMPLDQWPRGEGIWHENTAFDFFVPRDQAALMEPLKKPLNANADSGPRYLLLRDVPVPLSLDGMHLKNIVFRNLRIVYRGGPLILENVAFVNCTFDVPQEPRGARFAEALLKSGTYTNFSAA